ncbi:hypothetical protein PsYK624_118160 [Phanerochaete sordida]|uniref:F-box domain-containing protein n=1 Tax=Phanerochaete sordida TaxID=48140 RepID=A0A9P3GIC5_9APHY|nr:hypothetical protein PsYK624_118160 [Phanerochaete sordida]
MHRCLCVAEVVQLIADSAWPNRSTLLAMSTTCRAFFDPAMNSLWRSLSSPTLLITVLPEHARGATHETHLTVVRQPSEADWLRFDMYSRRVRYLQYYFTLEDGGDGSPFPAPRINWNSVLEYHPGGKLFPNLLHLTTTEHSIGDLWSLFIKPSLRFLSLDISPGEEASVSECLLTCATTLQICHIRNFCEQNTPSSYNIAHTVSSFQCLTQLVVGRLLPQTLQNLSHLPAVTHLDFWLDILDNSSQRLPFRSLQRLSVTVLTDDIMFSALLRRITAPRLLHLNVVYATRDEFALAGGGLLQYRFPTAVYTDALLAAASTFPTLQALDVKVYADPDLVPSPQEICTASVLQPLLALRGLLAVRLPTVPIVLTPNDIAAFAGAWPALRVLRLSDGLRHVRSSVKAPDLLPLAQCCAHLFELGLPLAIAADAGDVDGAAQVPPLGASAARVQTLRISNADIEFSPGAAVHLACLFPDAELHASGEAVPAFHLLKQTKRAVVEAIRRQLALRDAA